MSTPLTPLFSPAHRIIRTTRGGFRITTSCVCVRNNWPHITQKTSPTFGRAGRSSTRLAIATPAPTVTIAFTPGESPAVLKEIVGAIAGARNRLYVASVVLYSGPILVALSEAIDRGLPFGGVYDGPQMDQVERQWKAANVGTDKLNTWQKVARHLVRKNSIPFDRQNQSQPHNFMHNKLVVADQIVVTGSFNLSNHAMGNAENVLLIRDAAIAELYTKFIQRLMASYAVTPAV